MENETDARSVMNPKYATIRVRFPCSDISRTIPSVYDDPCCSVLIRRKEKASFIVPENAPPAKFVFKTLVQQTRIRATLVWILQPIFSAFGPSDTRDVQDFAQRAELIGQLSESVKSVVL